MSQENKSHQVKVGDELAFNTNFGHRWVIETVERITPSGRIVCGPWTLDPDLRVRRGRGSYSGPCRGEPVTKEIRRAVRRQELISIVSNLKARELDDEVLEAIVKVIEEKS